jgi:hypothetical protein
MNVLRTACHVAVMDLVTGHGLVCRTSVESSAPFSQPVSKEKGVAPRWHHGLPWLDLQEMDRQLKRVGWRLRPGDDEMKLDGTHCGCCTRSTPSGPTRPWRRWFRPTFNCGT